MNACAAAAEPWQTLLAGRIAAELGLHFPRERADDLDRALAALAQELGHPDPQACATWLCAVPWDDHLVRRLACHLTIGETYFFRDPELLQVVADHVLPGLIARRRAQGRLALRLWSAGCCTGEEAYSLAILVHEALPDLPRWQVAITATDVNPLFLAKARAGRFREWSFRGAPPRLRQRYFEQDGEGLWRIAPHIRDMVHFAELNLAGKGGQAAPGAFEAIDLLFCRNVLMYFSAPRARDAAALLRDSLAAGGWLAVSPSEACGSHFPGLAPVNFDGGVLFRRPEDSGTSQRIPAAPAQMPAEALRGDSFVAAPIRVARARPAVPASDSQAARALADQGRLDEALQRCDRWLAADALDAAGHYVRGLVLMERGDAGAAREALRRCLYLESQFVPALLGLAQLARSEGRQAEARRHFAAASALLDPLEPQQQLPEAGGLTAGRLRETLLALQQPGASS